MKKYIFSALVLATSMVACTEDYTDWTNPQHNDQPAVVSFGNGSVAAVGLIDYADEAVSAAEFVQVCKITAPTASNAAYNKVAYKINLGNAAYDVDAKGNMSVAELKKYVEDIYGKAPDVREIKATVDQWISNGKSSVRTAQSEAFNVNVKLLAPHISENYYVVGGSLDWEASAKSKAQKFEHSSKSVYDDPVFTITIPAAATGDTWFAIGDDEALEAQFGCNAEIEVNIERVVMRDEGTRCSTARKSGQHGGLDLEIVPLVQIAANGLNDLRPLAEGIAYVHIDHEIEIALAIARIHILQTVELFGQRAQRLREQVKVLDAHGNLAATRLEDNTANPDDVADVKTLELLLVLALTEDIHLEIDLYVSCAVIERREGCFAMSAYRHQASRDADFLPLLVLGEIVIALLEIGSIVRDLEAMPKRGDPHRTERIHLFAADTHHLIQILLCRLIFSFFSHPCPSYFLIFMILY